MKTYSFFAMLSRMKYINRWGLMRNVRSENISEHSLETALIAHALAIIGNKRLGKNFDPERAATLAIFHDVTEIITGDLPTPVKYHSPEIRKAYGEVEKLAAERLVDMLPEDMQEDYAKLLADHDEDEVYAPIIKAADKISAVIKCMEEKNSGNHEFTRAEETLRDAVKKLQLPEADIFMEEFLPAFALTLDELG